MGQNSNRKAHPDTNFFIGQTHPKAWGDQNYFLFSVHVKGIELIMSKVSDDVLELSSRLLASSLLYAKFLAKT